MRFSFCGVLLPIKDKSLVEQGVGKNGIPFMKIKFIVGAGSDRAFVEAFATTQESIKAVDRDGNKFDIPWEERFNAEMVNRATRKYVVNGFGERQAFLSQYDQIAYLETVLENYKGKLIVTGQMNKSYYNGRWYDNYAIQNIYAAGDEDKQRFYLQGDLIYNKDSVDTSVYAKDRIISVNAYIEQYIDKDHPNALVPQTFIFNASKVDMNNEAQVAALEFRELCLMPKTRKWLKLRWEMLLKNGQEEMEWDESQLTDFQRAAYKTGLWSLDDFKPTKKIYGERITEFRLFRPVLKDAFLNGAVEFGDDDIVESLIYRPGQVIVPTKTKELDIFGQDSSDLDDLFE